MDGNLGGVLYMDLPSAMDGGLDINLWTKDKWTKL